MQGFEALWEAHVEFGTSRSHKKLFGKKRKRVETEADDALRKKPTKAKPSPPSSSIPAISSGAADGSQSAKPSAAAGLANAARSEPLANKGRWGATMAARLLGGGT